MNKSNINDFLTKTLSVYTLLLFIIVILKLVGLDYFGLDVNNPIFVKFNNFILSHGLENVYYAATLLFYTYMFISISINENDIKVKIGSFIVTCISVVLKIIQTFIGNTIIIAIIDFVYLFFACLVLNSKNSKKEVLKRYFKVYMLNTIFQLISLFLRNVNYYNNNATFIINCLLDFDYILMLIIYYKLNFSKGGVKICGMEVISSSLKKIHLRKLLTKLQRNLDNFKKKTRVEKLEISIFIVLSLIWNTLSVVLILFVAKLNDTLIECIFILTSFWLSKTTFGKPFHFSKMSTCFIVSNLTYYALNRITTPLGISIIVPIILGVGLSYVTSKFVKEKATKLYKGIPEDEFNSSILNVTDKDSLQYKICHMFYVERKSELEIAHNVGYSIDNIKKIKAKINKKIKELS